MAAVLTSDLDSLKLVDSLIEGNLLRNSGFVKKESCDWNDSQLLVFIFVWYEYIVYNFELFMIPLALLLYVLFRLIAADELNNMAAAAVEFTSDCSESMNHIQIQTITDLNPIQTSTSPPPAPSEVHPMHKIQALMELVQVIRSILPVIHSIQVQILRLMEFMNVEPISWKFCKILLAVTLWLYIIGLRHLLMGLGCYVFVQIHPIFAKLRTYAVHILVKLKLLEYLPSEHLQELMKSAVEESENCPPELISSPEIALLSTPLTSFTRSSSSDSIISSEEDDNPKISELVDRLDSITPLIPSEPIPFMPKTERDIFRKSKSCVEATTCLDMDATTVVDQPSSIYHRKVTKMVRKDC